MRLLKELKIRFIMKFIGRFYFLFKIYLNYNKLKNLRSTYNFLIKKNVNPRDILTSKDLINFVLENSHSESCHIICSGESAIFTVKDIKPNDFVFGLNFSSLLYPRSDLHFAENANNYDDKSWLKAKILSSSVPAAIICC